VLVVTVVLVPLVLFVYVVELLGLFVFEFTG
jgi:hypothetical protein